MGTNTTNFYDVLGVSPKATREEIKQGYRELAMKFHPDKTGQNEDGMPLYEQWLKVNDAYQVLSNETKRAEYDGLTYTESPSYKGRETRTQTPRSEAKTHGKPKAETTQSAPVYEKEDVAGAGVDFDGTATKTTSRFGDYFLRYESYFGGSDGNVKVTDLVEGKILSKEYERPDFKNDGTENGFIFTFGKLKINQAELDLMAGYVEALNTKGPFIAECGNYRVIKEEDGKDGLRGQIKVEVRLGRFNKTSEGGDIKVGNESGWGYDVRSEDDFVNVNDVTTPFKVTGIDRHLLTYEGYLKKVIEMAQSIARGEVIDGNKVIELNALNCFPRDEGGMVQIEASNLRSELNRRVESWRIAVPEGTIFNHKEGVKVSRENTRV